MAKAKINPLVAAVDAYIREPKELLGVTGFGDWQSHQNTSGVGLEYRISWAVTRNGVSRDGDSLELVAHPNDLPQTWHFNLLFNYTRVAGFDEEHSARDHVNHLRRAGQGIPSMLRGSHIHLWEDNRHLATRAALPHLGVARPIPKQLAERRSNRFAQTLYYFCEQVGLQAPPAHIDIPRRSLLL